VCGACSPNGGKKRNAYRLLVGKPEGKRPLGSSNFQLFVSHWWCMDHSFQTRIRLGLGILKGTIF
jgi:hypothetical protein